MKKNAGNKELQGKFSLDTPPPIHPAVYLVHSQVAVCLLQFDIQEVFEGDVHGPILFHWCCLKAEGFGREIIGKGNYWEGKVIECSWRASFLMNPGLKRTQA